MLGGWVTGMVGVVVDFLPVGWCVVYYSEVVLLFSSTDYCLHTNATTVIVTQCE